jgi:hypothetical protein
MTEHSVLSAEPIAPSRTAPALIATLAKEVVVIHSTHRNTL